MSGLMHALIIAGIISFMAYVIWNHTRRLDGLKDNGALSSIPLAISPEEFRERFRAQIPKSKPYFQGELFSRGTFYIQYIPPMTADRGWIALRGIIKETEIQYDVVGRPIYRSEEFERERLVNKLRELCAPEPGTTPKAE